MSEATHVRVIEPGRAARNYWGDLWRYRELFYVLAWRDLSVRYKQTVLGVAWALLQPVLTMVILCVVFSVLARLPSEGDAPYVLLVFAAMLPWQFFASSLASASQSLVGNAQLISKVYFPRMIIPAASVVTSLVDFLISSAVLTGLMVWFQYWPTWRVLTLPLFIAMGLLAAMGPSLLFAALNVEYRDFRYVIPFVIQLGLYLSPVGYSSSLVRQRFGDTVFALYSINPLVGVIDGFRWALLGGEASIYWPGFMMSLLVIASFLLVGIWYFRRTEKSFADLI
jgi:lipopolysaccharide transport system permease protein